MKTTFLSFFLFLRVTALDRRKWPWARQVTVTELRGSRATVRVPSRAEGTGPRRYNLQTCCFGVWVGVLQRSGSELRTKEGL